MPVYQDNGAFLSDSILVKYELTTATCRIHKHSCKPANGAPGTVHHSQWGTRHCSPQPPFPHASFLFALARGSVLGCAVNCAVCAFVRVLWHFPLSTSFGSSAFTSSSSHLYTVVLFVPVMREHDAVELYKVRMVCLLLSPHRPYNFYCRIFLNS